MQLCVTIRSGHEVTSCLFQAGLISGDYPWGTRTEGSWSPGLPEWAEYTPARGVVGDFDTTNIFARMFVRINPTGKSFFLRQMA